MDQWFGGEPGSGGERKAPGIGGRLRTWFDPLWPPPPGCPFCGRRGNLVPVGLPELDRPRLAAACDRCAGQLTLRPPPPRCPGCARSTPAPGLCRDCLRHPLGLGRVCAYGAYRGALREAIHRVKFQRDVGPLELLAGMLAVAWRDLNPPADALIVPVPMHPEKKRALGWNHVERVAKGLGRAVGRAAVPALERRGELRSQATRGRRERLTALEGRFALSPEAAEIRERAVVLVDDVLTTGATAQACTRVLRAGGAREVYGLVIAR